MMGLAPKEEYMDWRNTNYLGFWIYGSMGENVAVAIVNNGIPQNRVNRFITQERQWVEIDMDTAGWQRDRIGAIRFYGASLSTENYPEGILRWAENMERDKLGGTKG